MTAARDAAIAMREAAAKVCEKMRDDRFDIWGTRDPDTNACYYTGRVAEELEMRDEEDESIAAAIRALPLPEVEPAQSVDMVTCGCGDMFPVGSYGHGFMDGAGHCANCVASAPQQVEQACEWHLSDDESDLWAASCGRESLVYCDGPVEAEIHFCPGCGKPLVVKEKNDE